MIGRRDYLRSSTYPPRRRQQKKNPLRDWTFPRHLLPPSQKCQSRLSRLDVEEGRCNFGTREKMHTCKKGRANVTTKLGLRQHTIDRDLAISSSVSDQFPLFLSLDSIPLLIVLYVESEKGLFKIKWDFMTCNISNLFGFRDRFKLWI